MVENQGWWLPTKEIPLETSGHSLTVRRQNKNAAALVRIQNSPLIVKPETRNTAVVMTWRKNKLQCLYIFIVSLHAWDIGNGYSPTMLIQCVLFNDIFTDMGFFRRYEMRLRNWEILLKRCPALFIPSKMQARRRPDGKLSAYITCVLIISESSIRTATQP